MKVLGNLFNDPLNFFRKKRSFANGFTLMLISMLVFVVMNQAMIELGLIKFVRSVGVVEAIVINYTTLLSGYFVVTAICTLPYMLVGGKRPIRLFTIVAYSLVPIVFLWIPHIVLQAIIIVLSLILITSGVSIYARVGIRSAFLVTLSFFVLVIAFSLVIQNYIILFSVQIG